MVSQAMIRKQVYIEPRHDQMLKRRAIQRGMTEAELIREALDSVETGSVVRRQESDPAAAREALAFMRSLSVSPRGRKWRRESLYKERMGRGATS
jgi:hypothetical protein